MISIIVTLIVGNGFFITPPRMWNLQEFLFN